MWHRVCSLTLLGTTVMAAGGAEITINFSGTVSEVPTEISSQFAAGDPVQGYYVLNNTLREGSDFSQTIVDYQVMFGDYSLAITESTRGDVAHHQDADYTAVAFVTGEAVNGVFPFLFALQLDDTTEQYLADESTGAPPSFSVFDDARWTLDLVGTDFIRLSGSLEAFQTDRGADCNGDGVIDVSDVNCAGADGNADLVSVILAEIGSIAGDVDGNGTVGFADFLVFSRNFDTSGQYTDGDFDLDGVVGFSDFLILTANFGMSGPSPILAEVPEPTSFFLFGFGVATLGLMRTQSSPTTNRTCFQGRETKRHGGGSYVRVTPGNRNQTSQVSR